MAEEARPGRIESIHVAESQGQPMRAVERIRLIAGVGLAGDRYAMGRGHFSSTPGTGRALTLIEAEVIESLRGDAGIALNALVGRRFRVGGVLCQGTRLCEPCNYLDAVAGMPLLQPLRNRGGLRADVLEEGEIAIGDAVRPE